MSKLFKFFSFGGLVFILSYGCSNKRLEVESEKVIHLQKRVKALEDSLHEYQLFYHFKSIKPIVVKSLETKDSSEYKLYMIADGMLINDSITQLKIKMKTKKGFVYSKKVNGYDNLLKLSKSHTGDTLNLMYDFHSGKGTNNISIPLEWTVE